MKIATWFCILIGAALIIYARIKGIDMTEGQILINYWLELLIGVAFLFIGGRLITKEN